MKLEKIRSAVVAGHTLRFAGLLAIGIGIGVAATEMLPEPVAAAANDCNSMRCDSTHFFWFDDVCRYQPGSHCWFVNSEDCVTGRCDPDTVEPCDDPDNQDEECNPN